MIWWHGVSSDDVNVIVERCPGITIPNRQIERVPIKGRNGDLVISHGAYENVVQPYEIYISAEAPRLLNMVHRVSEWLMVKGYQRLEDSYSLDYFRLATYDGGTEIESILGRFGRATINFNCKPQRFLKIGDVLRTMSKGKILINPTPEEAAPLLVVSGSGSGTVSIGDKTLTLTDCDGVTIDCDVMQVYRGSENLNSTASGDWPKIPGSASVAITWSGGVSGIAMKPRWWTV